MSSRAWVELVSVDAYGYGQLRLNGMIAHHQGAITLAKTEQQSGLNSEAMNLANSIVTSQAGEVTEMQQLLNAG